MEFEKQEKQRALASSSQDSPNIVPAIVVEEKLEDHQAIRSDQPEDTITATDPGQHSPKNVLKSLCINFAKIKNNFMSASLEITYFASLCRDESL